VTVTLTYYAAAGPIKHTITVPAGRHTVAVADPVEGAGANLGQVGITVTSDSNIVLEKSVYSANPAAYGAGSTAGASPTLVAFF
jgi:hypothetical protein